MSMFHHRRITKQSIKESLDNLPCGICFADQNGVICLCNHKMYELCHLLMGTDLQHLSELVYALKNPPPNIQALPEEKDVFRFPDGRIWRFVMETLTDEGDIFTQVQVSDLTELYAQKYELEKENRLLDEATLRAIKLNEELDEIVEEEERLALKAKVHDHFGACLLAVQKSMDGSGNVGEMREACRLWEKAIAGLNARSDEEVSDSWNTLGSYAASFGITVFHNTFDETQAVQTLLFAAVRECITNCARHARGTEVYVKITGNAFSITNNGEAPTGKICEGSGLSTLRQRIEKAGGSMTVQSSPIFCLTGILPEKDGEWI